MERRAQEIPERQLIEQVKHYRLVSVVGLAKNVGKTTVVNFLLRRLSQACVITVGVDGEKEDKIFKNTKPPVFLPKGNLAVVPSTEVPVGTKILETFETPSTPLSLVKALMDVEVHTVKIGSYEETLNVVKRIRKHAKTFVIDGALARMGSISISNAAILISGAEVGKSVEEVVDKTIKVVNKILTPRAPEYVIEIANKMPKVPFAIKNDKVVKIDTNGVAGYEEEIVKMAQGAQYLYLPGAVTNEIASRVECPIVVPSPDKIFSDAGNFLSIKETKLLAVALNHTSVRGYEVNPEELIIELKKRLNDGIIVFDVLYDHDEGGSKTWNLP